MENLNKRLAIASSKQIQIYELLIKIQNVINTESLLPRKKRELTNQHFNYLNN